MPDLPATLGQEPGEKHTHAHTHAHGERRDAARFAHRGPAAAPFSLLRLSASGRVLGVLLVIAALWGAVAWALH